MKQSIYNTQHATWHLILAFSSSPAKEKERMEKGEKNKPNTNNEIPSRREAHAYTNDERPKWGSDPSPKGRQSYPEPKLQEMIHSVLPENKSHTNKNKTKNGSQRISACQEVSPGWNPQPHLGAQFLMSHLCLKCLDKPHCRQTGRLYTKPWNSTNMEARWEEVGKHLSRGSHLPIHITSRVQDRGI